MMKYFAISWYNDFQCMGGNCPLTCCTSKWDISLTESEIEMYENLDHPFAEEIVKVIDRDKSVFMGDECGRCRMLTEDGWCRIVRACGEEYLSLTCSYYPRSAKEFGDVIERTVDITCPEAVSYLFKADEILFDFGEIEGSEVSVDFDYESYDSLSAVRNYLIELWLEDFPEISTVHKYFIMQHLYYKVRELIRQDTFGLETAKNIVNTYKNVEILNDLSGVATEIFSNIELRIKIIYYFLVLTTQPVLGHILRDEREDILPVLNEWLNDVDVMQRDILTYLYYFRQTYPKTADRYTVYILFYCWMDRSVENKTNCAVLSDEFILKCMEWTWIQLVAATDYKRHKTVRMFEVLIAKIDRIFSHSKEFKGKILALIKENNLDTEANMLLLMMM